jgi:hypothetical protein
MIKLTKEINGKKVELDLISLDGKTVVRNSEELEKKGLSKNDLKKAGYEVK